MFIIISSTSYETSNEFHAVFNTYEEAVAFFKLPICTSGDMYFGEQINIVNVPVGVEYDWRIHIVADVQAEADMVVAGTESAYKIMKRGDVPRNQYWFKQLS